MRQPLSRILLMITMMSVTLLTPATLRGDEDADRIVGLKAAFVLNFIRYTEWPDAAFTDAHAPLRVAVVQNPAAARDLTRLAAGKHVHGRTLRVTLVTARDRTPQQIAAALAGFQAVYFCDLPPALARAVIRELPPPYTLTASDLPALVRHGAMLGVVREGDRLGIQANLDAIRRSRLSVSSKLLSLARVEPTETGP